MSSTICHIKLPVFGMFLIRLVFSLDRGGGQWVRRGGLVAFRELLFTVGFPECWVWARDG